MSVLSLLSLLSCQTNPISWAEEWDKNPERTGQRIAALTNPIEQLAAVVEVTESRPGKTASLCPLLTDKDVQARCERINQRPHLWTEVRSLSNANEGEPMAPVATKAPLAATTAITPECPTGKASNHCADVEAGMAAKLGQTERAAGICNSISSPKWRGECFFQAAEAALERKGAHGYGSGVDLCLAAAPFEQNCQSHLIMALAKRAPNAHRSDPSAWIEIQEAEGAVTSAWSWRDKEMAKKASDRLWSESLAVAYAGTKPVTGDPVSALGIEQKPHIRAAIMRRLMQIDPPDSLNLNGWIALAEKAWNARENNLKAKRDPNRKHMAVADLWPQSAEPPAGSESGAYMATSRRLIAPDAKIDWQICALEAAARMPPHHQSLLAEGAKSEEPLIRWTAERLLRRIDSP